MSDSSQIYRDNSLLTQDDSVWTDYEQLSQSPYNYVWRAKSDGQWFVLKSARSDVAGEESRYITMLRREYNLLRRLDCPYIVRVWQWREDGKVGQCIVEEYVSGKPLDVWLRHSPSAAQRRRVFDELIEAVKYIHANQIVHGDIKPQNILITDNGGHVKLLDFSMADADAFLAKNIGYSDTFAAPEQKNGQPTDCRTDIYALGQIISLLFPRRFRLIVRRCTNPSPERRYATVTAMHNALRRAVRAPRWAGAITFLLTLLLVDVLYMHSYTETLSQASSAKQEMMDSLNNEYKSLLDRYSAEQMLQDSLLDENKHLTYKVDSLVTLLLPSAAELALLDSLHKAYQRIANRYLDSLRMIPPGQDENFYLSKYGSRWPRERIKSMWGSEMFDIMKEAEKQNPSFRKAIMEDWNYYSADEYCFKPYDNL